MKFDRNNLHTERIQKRKSTSPPPPPLINSTGRHHVRVFPYTRINYTAALHRRGSPDRFLPRSPLPLPVFRLSRLSHHSPRGRVAQTSEIYERISFRRRHRVQKQKQKPEGCSWCARACAQKSCFS